MHPSDDFRFDEVHFSAAKIAKKWNLSTDSVRRLFRKEPGVLVLPSRNAHLSKRTRYTTLRVPASVMERVYRRLVVGKF
jgi:hypothetical protein